MHLPPMDCFDNKALYWLSISSGVRINQQGFTFYDAPVRHTTESYECPRMIGALCVHANNYMFFRCTDTPLTMANDVPSPFKALWNMEGCKGKIPSLNRFDVMTCDLKDGTSLIWADNRISMQYKMDVPYWPTFIVSLVVVWLVINMGESIASILRVRGSESSGKITSGLCTVLVITIVSNTPSELWITDSERLLFIFTAVYILLYSAFHIINPHTVNVIVGCLVMVTARYTNNNNHSLHYFLHMYAHQSSSSSSREIVLIKTNRLLLLLKAGSTSTMIHHTQQDSCSVLQRVLFKRCT